MDIVVYPTKNGGGDCKGGGINTIPVKEFPVLPNRTLRRSKLVNDSRQPWPLEEAELVPQRLNTQGLVVLTMSAIDSLFSVTSRARQLMRKFAEAGVRLYLRDAGPNDPPKIYGELKTNCLL